ncbi:MAG: antiviral reverse transcriptase Drt3b [Cyclobacteriaceae bacterium]
MRTKYKKIGYRKERVLLSDTLPYEVPPFFSNRTLYSFIGDNKISLIEVTGKSYRFQLRYKKNITIAAEHLIRLLFGIPFSVPPDVRDDTFYFKISENNIITIPFSFRISHKKKEFRELSVPHPLNQLLFINFYNQYKSDIIYNCSKSNFSLRKPTKLASIKNFKDGIFKKRKSRNPEFEIIETEGKEYTSLKTYFVYEEYSNIYKFYESKSFHLAEQRFECLLKFDVTRCFDSIYTHSLAWALNNKSIIKESTNSRGKTFGGVFDELMQKLNYNETNGIIIGPEFSRIFAEMILQRIDFDIEKELSASGYTHKKDYDVFRYLDDFFVFYNSEKIGEDIFSKYKLKLKEYNLFLNDSKTENFSKPIITNITKAKEFIRVLIDSSSIFRFLEENHKKENLKHHYSSDVITNYKSILSNTSTTYKDLQNYFLASIFNKTKQLITKYEDVQQNIITQTLKSSDLEGQLLKPALTREKKQDIKEQLEKIGIELEVCKSDIAIYHNQIHKKFIEIIDLTFFIYSVLPRVSYSIKVCHILFKIVDFISNQEKTRNKLSKPNLAHLLEKMEVGFNFDVKHLVFKHIYEGVSLILRKKQDESYSDIETLYILAIVNELGEHYEISAEVLISHFDLENKNKLSYFIIVSLLHHIGRKKKYFGIKKILQSRISDIFENYDSNNSEHTLLLIDVLLCPYFGYNESDGQNFKLKIINLTDFYDRNTSREHKIQALSSLESEYKDFFIKWNKPDIGKELNTKRGHEVY